jgi:hypothetical protein
MKVIDNNINISFYSCLDVLVIGENDFSSILIDKKKEEEINEDNKEIYIQVDVSNNFVDDDFIQI